VWRATRRRNVVTLTTPSTVLDDFSRFIVAWKLCATLKAKDVTATLDLALFASGLDKMTVVHRPRLL
jgi:putative transposase